MPGIITFILSLVFIVCVAYLFCNALEHLGEKLGVSDGVTGSIFAAVGTALPETIIPILAIMGFRQGVGFKQIGVGAILGAPLMLSTLSLFVMALSIVGKRGFNGHIKPHMHGLRRDLQFFLFSYTLAFIAAFTYRLSNYELINSLIVITLFLSYFMYVLLTVQASGKGGSANEQTTADKSLFLARLGLKANLYTTYLQLALSLVMLVYFAELFIDAVNKTALLFQVSPFLLALIIVPIATELPEKINSIIWLRKGKDTLAMGNITGAMVFQGTLLPIIGIVFTKWQFGNASMLPFTGMLITLCATLWLYFNACRNTIKVWHFSINGLLYLLNLLICIKII